ncbi:hypothetical protein [Flavobacterium sp.]|uniref:hypothetical protein n=1 Tax=Flavobacterium sp. TaxID=239 RepID=UPI0040484BC5
MVKNKIDLFIEKAPIIFKRLIENYGYLLQDTEIFQINGEDWSTKLIYINSDKRRKIEIEQAPYYSDYGFTFFIYNLDNNEYLIACNIPNENQDNNSDFIKNACDIIFSNDSYEKVINGMFWIKQN